MERLTHRCDLGLDEWEQIAFLVKEDQEGLYNIVDLATNCREKRFGNILIQIAERLAEYEETGLTPEEIINLNDFTKSQLSKLLFQCSQLEKVCNYWRNESIKDKAKLGEIRILMDKQ